MIEWILPIIVMFFGVIFLWILKLFAWIPSAIILPLGWLIFVFWQKMWPVGLICFEKRGDHWILGKLTPTGARRIKKRDGTYNYQIRPYKTKITPPPFENLITDGKGKTWLVAFSPNANSFRAAKPKEIPNETTLNLTVEGINNPIGNGGLKIGMVELPKVSFDTTDQHDIKDFMEDWREKRERMISGSFLQKWGIHILFLIEAVFIFILLITLIQGMPEMTNIWMQTARVTKEATDNLLKAIGMMQQQGVVPGGEKPPW